MPTTKLAARNSALLENSLKTGPGTDSGEYLRRFWQPVYHSADLAPGAAVPLTIMSENFTLYRGESGARLPGRRALPASRRAALGRLGRGRRAALLLPRLEIRRRRRSASSSRPKIRRSRDKVAIRTYPAREYLGLIFAYLGDGERAGVSAAIPSSSDFGGLRSRSTPICASATTSRISRTRST